MPRNAIRSYHIIGIKRHYKITRGFLYAQISGTCRSCVFLVEVFDFIVFETGYYIFGIVGGTVINNDKLEISIVLNENAFDCLCDILGGIVGGHYH
ncbi:hypothetical protein ES703_87955 [subsurface metagenome]